MRSTAVCRSASSSTRSEEHTSELQSRLHLVCRLLLEKQTTTRITVAFLMIRLATLSIKSYQTTIPKIVPQITWIIIELVCTLVHQLSSRKNTHLIATT